MSEHTGDRPDTPDEEQEVGAPRPGPDETPADATDGATPTEDAAEPGEPDDAAEAVQDGELDEGDEVTDDAGPDPDDVSPVEPAPPEDLEPVAEGDGLALDPSDTEREDDADDRDDRDAADPEVRQAAAAPEPADPVDEDHEDRPDESHDAVPRPAADGDDDMADDATPGTDEPAASAALGAAAASTPREEPSGWRRLGEALRPRATRSQVLAGVLCAALGFALVVQVQQSASDQLSSARQEDLVRLLDEVTDRAQQLGDEVSGLETTRDELLSGSGKAQSALELAQQRAESEGILSGRLPAQGPGVRVTVEDPSHSLKASQMFNVLEELRNAGAEVVELNDVRLVTSTWFEDEGDQIVVDGTTLSSPYEWTVIGDPETLDRALEIPGGALATVRTAGAEASTSRHDQVKVAAVTPPEEPEYAKPGQER
ncbi:DUF881 domain-containing protein [Promicromonospora sp. Marseille-Q5078]